MRDNISDQEVRGVRVYLASVAGVEPSSYLERRKEKRDEPAEPEAKARRGSIPLELTSVDNASRLSW